MRPITTAICAVPDWMATATGEVWDAESQQRWRQQQQLSPEWRDIQGS